MSSDLKMSLAMDETRMKGGLSRSAGIPAGLGRLELVCAPAPRCSWGAAGSFVRGKPAGMPALRTTRASAGPIFIVCGAACGMATDQKMPAGSDGAKLLECASPLALWGRAAGKRQRTAAVQDASRRPVACPIFGACGVACDMAPDPRM